MKPMYITFVEKDAGFCDGLFLRGIPGDGISNGFSASFAPKARARASTLAHA